MTQREKEIEVRILDRLNDGPSRLEIKNSTSDAKNLVALLGQHKPIVFRDTSAWNLHSNFMQDVIGGMVPGQGYRAARLRDRRLPNNSMLSSPACHHHARSQGRQRH